MQDVKTMLMLRKKRSGNVVEDGFLIMNLNAESQTCLFRFFFFGANHILQNHVRDIVEKNHVLRYDFCFFINQYPILQKILKEVGITEMYNEIFFLHHAGNSLNL
jgi:hypothetical protein